MIRKMLGVSNIFRPTMKAKITADVQSAVGVTSFVRATVESDSSGSSVTPLSDQAELFTLSDAQALIAIHADSPGALKGESVEIMVLDRSN